MDLFDHAEKQSAATPFAIRKGIPKPIVRDTNLRTTWEKPVFRFSDMEVGDCFDVWPHECGNQALIVVQNFVSGQAATWRKKNAPDRQFSTRQIQGQLVRCWRDK